MRQCRTTHGSHAQNCDHPDNAAEEQCRHSFSAKRTRWIGRVRIGPRLKRRWCRWRDGAIIALPAICARASRVEERMMLWLLRKDLTSRIDLVGVAGALVVCAYAIALEGVAQAFGEADVSRTARMSVDPLVEARSIRTARPRPTFGAHEAAAGASMPLRVARAASCSHAHSVVRAGLKRANGAAGVHRSCLQLSRL